MGKIEGSVVSVTESGSLVTDIESTQLAGVPTDDRVTVACDDHETSGIFDLGHEQPAATLIAVVGDDSRLRLEIVGDSARMMLGVDVGARVEVRW